MTEYIIFKKKWRKRRENECERIVHEDNVKSNLKGSRKCKHMMRKN